VDAAASPGSVPTPSQLVESTGTSTSSNSNLAQGLSSPSQPSAKADVAASGESRTVTDVSTSGTTDGSAIGTSKSEEAIQSAHARIEEGKWYEALFNLSLQYGSGELTEEERRRLGDLLDPLAGKVVYSKEHLIEPAYEVRRGETLMDIAERHNVPWQLLANINEVKDPQVLLPGTKLKVVPGPFRAEVDLARRELVLFAGRLYAGRFPITVGSNPAPKPGEYRVNDKQAGRTFYAGGGQTIPAGDPANPYGQIWIDLGGDVCIHGSPEKVQGGMGCISLSPTDANDVYGILSRGSGVVVRR
jgi:lipoprotein-anchoring transpeptidase ErfK/SrfK